MNSLHKAWLNLSGAITAKDEAALGKAPDLEENASGLSYDTLFESQEEYEKEVKEVVELIRAGSVQPREPDTDDSV
ncbi:MAG TPA: hypothetical protein VF598_13470 [Hymenobacter sp.]|jgi:hypothetical protein